MIPRVLLLTILLSLSACSTVEGLGRDISEGARRVGDAL